MNANPMTSYISSYIGQLLDFALILKVFKQFLQHFMVLHQRTCMMSFQCINQDGLSDTLV